MEIKIKKKSLDGFNGRVKMTENRFSEFENLSVEFTQSKKWVPKGHSGKELTCH